MKKAIAVLLSAMMLAAVLCCAGCTDEKDKVFEPSSDLRKEAEQVLASLGQDRRIDEYLKIRPSLEIYSRSTRRQAIQKELEELKKLYSGIDSELSFDQGAKIVNDQLFDYLVEGTYYYKAEFGEPLMKDTPELTKAITAGGYKLVYEFHNNGGHVGTKYYYGNGDVHDDLNYYSISELSTGEIEYISLPVFYEPLIEQFVESYAAKSAEERAVVFEDSVKYFVRKADVRNNAVLQLIYSEQELEALQSFLESLDIEFLDEHNLSAEEEPYSNRQIAVELGSTRFILRITLYGMYMDVIQNKDYYHGSFYKGLETLRRAYVGSEPSDPNDDIYIVIPV